MRVLVVCSKNSGKIAPFVTEQVDALNKLGVVTDYFTIEQKGWKGYLNSRKDLIKKITQFEPDLIHAHFGLSGLLANLQRKIPVITTYHGSDINNDKVFRFSKLAMHLSKYNIFVSQKNIDKAQVSKNFALIPCGVDTNVFYPKDKTECRKALNLDVDKKYILFAGAFENKVKNSVLAFEAVKILSVNHQIELLELKGYTREKVVLLMNAVDCCLMTSHTEGSPQFIKETMACNCPIVSTDVGDVKLNLQGLDGCFVGKTYESKEFAMLLAKVLSLNKRTNGRERILKLGLDNKTVVKCLMEIYKQAKGANTL